jgi:hypothetical protein
VRGRRSLCDIFEIEVAVITKEETSKCDEKLGERRVHVHEILCFDVLACELAEMNFVEAVCGKAESPTCTKNRTYTTLAGWDNRNSRTPIATRITTARSFHSPDVMFRPPGAMPRLLGAWLIAAATVLRSSPSRWSSFRCGKRFDVRAPPLSGGDAGRRTRTLVMVACVKTTVGYRSGKWQEDESVAVFVGHLDVAVRAPKSGSVIVASVCASVVYYKLVNRRL